MRTLLSLREAGGRMRRREVASAKNTQLRITPAGAAPKTSVYEPVTSYREPATVGPSAAPRRQPRVSTPMIAPRARIPNTSGMTFTVIVSAAAKPIPNATSDAKRPSADGHSSRPTRPAIWTTKATRMVASAPIRSETAPAARRPIAEPMPYAVRASEATARLRPLSRTNGTAWTEIMKARPALEEPRRVQIPLARIGERLGQGGARLLDAGLGAAPAPSRPADPARPLPPAATARSARPASRARRSRSRSSA